MYNYDAVKACLADLGFSQEQVNEMVFHLSDCATDLVCFRLWLDDPQAPHPLRSDTKLNPRSVLNGVLVHVPWHVKRAAQIYLDKSPRDSGLDEVILTKPGIADEDMFRPCPEEGCPDAGCTCLNFKPIPEEQMTALEQVVYQQVFSGDAELERVQQTTLHFLAWRQELNDLADLLYQPEKLATGTDGVKPILDSFFRVVPGHLLALEHLHAEQYCLMTDSQKRFSLHQ